MDSFLAAHQMGDLAVFQLGGGRLNTISIRDQMIRAQILSGRLITWLNEREQSIRKNLRNVHRNAPLLVIGGGASGLTAAVSLAQHERRVHVVEKQRLPFFLQRNCNSRWVDPNQYDWPIDSWEFEQFPWPMFSRTSVRFPWRADRAREIVRNDWQPQLRNYRRYLRPWLNLHYGVVATTMEPRRNKLIHVEFDYANNSPGTPADQPSSAEAPSREDFAAVIVARGFGSERTALRSSPDFRGLPFWENDSFEDVHFGRPSGKNYHVFISGTGDGALQDFLRIVTRKRSVREIFWILDLAGWEDAIAGIHSAEHRLERAMNWMSGSPDAAKFLREVHRVHQRLVSRILKDDVSLRGRAARLLDNAPVKTILVNSRDYFTCTYPLNRFLALLMAQAKSDDSIEVRENREVVDVTTAAPPVPVTAQSCLGQQWQIRLKNVSDPEAEPELVSADIVVLRHGLDFSEDQRADDASLGDMPRPMVPTHLP